MLNKNCPGNESLTIALTAQFQLGPPYRQDQYLGDPPPISAGPPPPPYFMTSPLF